MNCDVTSGLPFAHVRSTVVCLSMESLVIFEFSSTANGAAYLNKRISAENSNVDGAVCLSCSYCTRETGETGAQKEDLQRARRYCKTS